MAASQDDRCPNIHKIDSTWRYAIVFFNKGSKALSLKNGDLAQSNLYEFLKSLGS
jgi:hypothetical protein